MIAIVFVSLLVIAIIWLYVHFNKRYQFWKDLNVSYVTPTFPVGNMGETLKTNIHFSYIIEKLYKKLKSDDGYAGMFFFGNPVLLITSPEFAKIVLIKDFHYFMDRGIYFHETADPLSANLFFLQGTKWKNLRSKITPTFTSGKLKQMFHTVVDVARHLEQYLEPIAASEQDLDIRDLMGRFMTDVIGSCAFGFECNSLENPNTEFRTYGKKMLNFPKLKALKLIVASVFQTQARALNIRWNDKDVSDFFMKVVKETIEHREKNGIKRKDFMQLLIDLRIDTSNGENEGLTFDEIAAQAFVFFFAGFETSSTTLTFALHTLAHNQEIQEKARQSIKNILSKHNGEWTYDSVMEMNYIGQVIDETLRIYPPVGDIHRKVSKPYTLPNGSVVPPDIAVMIPVLAFHRSSEYFPDPMRFDPDRFSEEQKYSRHPFAFLPFGEGGRQCIGMRFGQLQTRLGLAMLLNKFIFNVGTKTCNPIKIDTVNLIHAPAGEVWLEIQKV